MKLHELLTVMNTLSADLIGGRLNPNADVVVTDEDGITYDLGAFIGVEGFGVRSEINFKLGEY